MSSATATQLCLHQRSSPPHDAILSPPTRAIHGPSTHSSPSRADSSRAASARTLAQHSPAGRRHHGLPCTVEHCEPWRNAVLALVRLPRAAARRVLAPPAVDARDVPSRGPPGAVHGAPTLGPARRRRASVCAATAPSRATRPPTIAGTAASTSARIRPFPARTLHFPRLQLSRIALLHGRALDPARTVRRRRRAKEPTVCGQGRRECGAGTKGREGERQPGVLGAGLSCGWGIGTVL